MSIEHRNRIQALEDRAVATERVIAELRAELSRLIEQDLQETRAMLAKQPAAGRARG